MNNREAFKCELCGDPIYVGEDYYNIPGVGKCCEGCIAECHEYDAEDEAFNAYVDRLIDEQKEERIIYEQDR
jgi:hypothetical protein